MVKLMLWGVVDAGMLYFVHCWAVSEMAKCLILLMLSGVISAYYLYTKSMAFMSDE